MTIDKIFEIVEKERVRQKFKIKDLSAKAGHHQNVYSNWRNNRYIPSFKILNDYLDALDIELVLRRKKHDGT